MLKKKVLLLNPPADRLYQNDNYCSFSSKAGYYWPSIDLLAQSGILAAQCDVSVMDAIVLGWDIRTTRRAIKRLSPDAILFVTGTASWKQQFIFLEDLKKEVPATMIGSGGNLLFQAERFMNGNPFLDGILMDYTSDALLRLSRGDEGAIPNLVIRRGNGVVTGSRSGPGEEISYPPPRHDLFPLAKYRLPFAGRSPFTRMLTSIGCPYRCTFCCTAHIPHRVRSIHNIVQELRALEQYGIHQIDFCDPTLPLRRERTLDLCRGIISTGSSFSWSCNSRVDTVDEEQLRMMRKAGCHIIMFGVESGSPSMLQRYSKGITPDQIRSTFRLCKGLGIETLAFFIMGLPGETRESAEETIALARELNPDYVSFDLATPDFGTGLMREAAEKGWIPKSLDSFDSTTYPVIEIGTLSKNEVWKLRNRAYMRFYIRPRYLMRRIAHVRSIRELRALVSMGLRLILSIFRKD